MATWGGNASGMANSADPDTIPFSKAYCTVWTKSAVDIFLILLFYENCLLGDNYMKC